jgi:hypothetical protein
LSVRPEVQVECNAGVEVNAFEHPRERPFARGKTVAVGADGAGESEEEAVRAVLEVVQRLGIGLRRIGVIDALHEGPRRSRRTPGDGLRLRLALVERLDRDRVVGLGDEAAVEWRALEDVLHQLAPLFACGGGELGGERKFVG